MPLSKDVLGLDLYDRFDDFNNKTIDELGDIEAKRLEFFKELAEALINHFTTFGVVTVVTTGTPTNHTGTGTIS